MMMVLYTVNYLIVDMLVNVVVTGISGGFAARMLGKVKAPVVG